MLLLKAAYAKHFSLFASFLLFLFISQSQPTTKYYSCEPVRTEARFNDSINTWENYLKNHVNTEIPVFNCAPSGIYKVEVRFLIEKDGSINNIKPLTTHGYGMEDEVCKVVKSSPKWIPSTQNGKLTRTYLRQLFVFIVPELNSVLL